MTDPLHIPIQGGAGNQIGSHNNQFNRYAARVPSPHEVSVPPGAHNLPPPTAVFVGRDLEQVDTLLAGSRSGVVVGQVAVHGLGGIGKTELAINYAHVYLHRFPLVWWITADGADNISQGLVRLASRLQSADAVAHGQEWAIGWLQAHPGWLLILDNVEKIADIRPLLGQLAGCGSVLITTRRDPSASGWAPLGLAPLQLDPLTRAASIDLLIRLTRNDDRTGADALAEDLGDLPLALEQAAAYISRRRGMDFHSYRTLLASRFDKASRHGGRGGDTERTISQVWQVTMARITEQSPLARTVLDVMAWLAPEDLPEDVLFPLADDPDDVLDAIALLAEHNMINWQDHAVSVHRLVQAVAREEHADDPGPATEAVRLLAAATPDGDPFTAVVGWPRWNDLVPHIDALYASLPANRRDVRLLQTVDHAATFRHGQGHAEAAVFLYEQIIADRQRLLGDDDQGTMTTRNHLALAYADMGRTAEAITLLTLVVADQERIRGDHDIATQLARHSLAYAYVKARREADAIPLYEAILAADQRQLDDDHPDTLVTRVNLAVAYGLVGRAAEGITLQEAVQVDLRRVRGDDHPVTLFSRAYLAVAYQEAGRVAEAVAQHEALLVDQRRVLGDDHPDTLNNRRWLAMAYLRAARGAEALDLLERVLADSQRVLGAGHNSTRAVVESLNWMKAELGRRPADRAGASPETPARGTP